MAMFIDKDAGMSAGESGESSSTAFQEATVGVPLSPGSSATGRPSVIGSETNSSESQDNLSESSHLPAQSSTSGTSRHGEGSSHADSRTTEHTTSNQSSRTGRSGLQLSAENLSVSSHLPAQSSTSGSSRHGESSRGGSRTEHTSSQQLHDSNQSSRTGRSGLQLSAENLSEKSHLPAQSSTSGSSRHGDSTTHIDSRTEHTSSQQLHDSNQSSRTGRSGLQLSAGNLSEKSHLPAQSSTSGSSRHGDSTTHIDSRSEHTTSQQLHNSNQSSRTGRSGLQLSAGNLSEKSHLPAQSSTSGSSRHGESSHGGSTSMPNEPSRELSGSEAIAESYRREFEDLLEQDERGETVDEERLYFLELYARSWVGENLDEEEMRDLEEFEESERHREMLQAQKVAMGKTQDAVEQLETDGELPPKLNAEAAPSGNSTMEQEAFEETAGKLQPDQNTEEGPSEADPSGKPFMEHQETAREFRPKLNIEADSSTNSITNHEAGTETAGQLPSNLNAFAGSSANPVMLDMLDESKDLEGFEESEESESRRAVLEAQKVAMGKTQDTVEQYESYEETAGELPPNLSSEAALSEAGPSGKPVTEQEAFEETARKLQPDLNTEEGSSEADPSGKPFMEHEETARELRPNLNIEADSSGNPITNHEAGKETAGQPLPSKLNADAGSSANPVILDKLVESVNSSVPMEPWNKVKKMKMNSNIYEIDRPGRLDSFKVSAENKSVNSGSVLRNVDASLSRLQKGGKAIHTNRIRRSLSAEKLKLQRLQTPHGASRKSGSRVANQKDFPVHSNTSDPAVLIAHAGTKLQKRENVRKLVKQNPPSRINGTRINNGLRRKERRSQNAKILSLAAASDRRKNRAAHSESREDEYIPRTSTIRRGGEKSRIPIRAPKAGRNRGGSQQNNHPRGSKHPSAYNDRRKLANLILNRHRSDPSGEQATSHPTNVKIRSRKSKKQQSAIPSSEKSGQRLSTLAAATPQKSLVVSASPNNLIKESEIIKDKRSQPEMREKVDPSLHFLSQLNQAERNRGGRNSGGMSKAISVLQQNGGKLLKKHERVHSSIRNERFLMATDLAYERIVKENPRRELLFSIAEWRHVHVLMLYARVFQCELAAENIDQPREFSIYLPDSLQVFEPLGVVLASIGVVEDKEGGLSYVPIAKPLQGKDYEPHNPNDVTVFMEWSQYKWNASWTQVKFERKRRKKDAKNRGIEIPGQVPSSPNRSKLQNWENVALEMWLGWDEELWFGYNLFVDSVSRSFSFVDFPSSTLGTYAWLIPSYNTTKGAYARIPNPNVGNAVWMIALLFDLSDLPSQNIASWFCKTDTVYDIKGTLLQFLDSAAKK